MDTTEKDKESISNRNQSNKKLHLKMSDINISLVGRNSKSMRKEILLVHLENP